MALRHRFALLAAAFLIGCAGVDLRAAGILADRLTPRQLPIWREIETVVLARDSSGFPIHPMLYSLWQQLEISGYLVAIEFPEPKGVSSCSGGQFVVEKTSSGETPGIGVIRLFLQDIDRASTAEVARRSDGFLPFQYLSSRPLRYAEVLGHEMAHALQILSREDPLRLTGDLKQEAERLLHDICRHKGTAFHEEIRSRAKKVELMREAIEKPAREAEAAVWRELAATQRAAGARPSAVSVHLSRASGEIGKRK